MFGSSSNTPVVLHLLIPWATATQLACLLVCWVIAVAAAATAVFASV
jgi:hypothetical protein